MTTRRKWNERIQERHRTHQADFTEQGLPKEASARGVARPLQISGRSGETHRNNFMAACLLEASASVFLNAAIRNDSHMNSTFNRAAQIHELSKKHKNAPRTIFSYENQCTKTGNSLIDGAGNGKSETRFAKIDV